MKVVKIIAIALVVLLALWLARLGLSYLIL